MGFELANQVKASFKGWESKFGTTVEVHVLTRGCYHASSEIIRNLWI